MNYKKLSLILILLVMPTSYISQSIAGESKAGSNSVIFPTPPYSSVYRKTQSIYTRSLELLFKSSQYSDDNAGERHKGTEEKHRLLRDLGNMGKTYLSDSWNIYSSPARINGHNAYWLVAFTTTAGILYAYDQDIYDGLKRNEDDQLYRPFRKIGRTFEPIGMMGITNKYYFGGLAAGYIFRIRPLMEVSAQILESHFIAGGAKNVANIIVGRTRPHEGKGPRNFEFNKGTSFPSGHASSIFQVATVLSHHLRFQPATVVLYGIATSVAFQRVTSDSHWPSDVFIASVYGIAVSRAVIRLHENRKAKLTTVPLIKGEAVGLSFHLEF
jgi:undecaprenyl-diphosphatase